MHKHTDLLHINPTDITVSENKMHKQGTYIHIIYIGKTQQQLVLRVLPSSVYVKRQYRVDRGMFKWQINATYRLLVGWLVVGVLHPGTIKGHIRTSDNAHSWQLHSAVALADQIYSHMNKCIYM